MFNHAETSTQSSSHDTPVPKSDADADPPSVGSSSPNTKSEARPSGYGRLASSFEDSPLIEAWLF